MLKNKKGLIFGLANDHSIAWGIAKSLYGQGAKIAAQAGITKNVESGAFLKGNPALPYALAQRIAILQKKLPDLFKRFADLDENS